MLQELDVHSLTNNIDIASKHLKGDSGEWPIQTDKISRRARKRIIAIYKESQVGGILASGIQIS